MYCQVRYSYVSEIFRRFKLPKVLFTSFSTKRFSVRSFSSLLSTPLPPPKKVCLFICFSSCNISRTHACSDSVLLHSAFSHVRGYFETASVSRRFIIVSSPRNVTFSSDMKILCSFRLFFVIVTHISLPEHPTTLGALLCSPKVSHESISVDCPEKVRLVFVTVL